jgi:hypothetical protein
MPNDPSGRSATARAFGNVPITVIHTQLLRLCGKDVGAKRVREQVVPLAKISLLYPAIIRCRPFITSRCREVASGRPDNLLGRES